MRGIRAYTLPMNIAVAKPIDARIVRTRGHLQQALLDLLDEKRMEDITVIDVAARADVGYATFFRHYPDKQALWDAVFDTQIDAMSELVQPLFSMGDHNGAARRLCELVDQRRDIYRILLAGSSVDLAREKMMANAHRLAHDHSHRPPPFGLPKTLGSEFGVSAILSILGWWLNGRDDVSVETMTRALDKLVFTTLFEG